MTTHSSTTNAVALPAQSSLFATSPKNVLAHVTRSRPSPYTRFAPDFSDIPELSAIEARELAKEANDELRETLTFYAALTEWLDQRDHRRRLADDFAQPPTDDDNWVAYLTRDYSESSEHGEAVDPYSHGRPWAGEDLGVYQRSLEVGYTQP